MYESTPLQTQSSVPMIQFNNQNTERLFNRTLSKIQDFEMMCRFARNVQSIFDRKIVSESNEVNDFTITSRDIVDAQRMTFALSK